MVSKKNSLLAAAFLTATIALTGCGDSKISGTMSYSDLLKEAQAGKVQKVEIDNATNKITLNQHSIRGGLSGEEMTVVAPRGTDAAKALEERGVDVSAIETQPSQYMYLLASLLPALLIVGVMVYMMRGAAGANNKALSFGRSKAKLLDSNRKKVTFSDVAGVDEAKEELQEVVEFLKNPSKFQKLGAKIPKGALLMGPPGTGKTLLARAVAGEANVPFFSISGSDFVEMFVGVGASRVRDLFDQGKKNAPCIIFIDEIDAVGRHRGAGMGGGHDEREQTLNQLLVEMDGFESNEGVILMASTNRPDVLDPALLRPGRFDRQVTVDRPDIKGREMILGIHARKVPLAEDVNLKVVARGTPGFSGADLANLVNEAALLAARRDKTKVDHWDFEEARDKVMMGAQRKSMQMPEEEEELTAWHEAGHAIIALNVEGSDPLHKVTVLPRGRALGVTWSLPETDRHGYSVRQIKAMLVQLCAGRIAEGMLRGWDGVTTGASNDILKATELATRMVKEWGMSEKLGFVKYGTEEQEIFLGRSVTQSQNTAEETAREVDLEIKRIVMDAYGEATKVLDDRKEDLRNLAEALKKFKELSADEARAAIRGQLPDDFAAGYTKTGPSSTPPAPPAPPAAPPSGNFRLQL